LFLNHVITDQHIVDCYHAKIFTKICQQKLRDGKWHGNERPNAFGWLSFSTAGY
jgi:hypothetical protein